MDYLNVDMSEDQPRKGFVNFSYETTGLRPYHPERARSRLISEAKQGRAWLVLGWETTEHNKNPLFKFQRYFVTYTSKVASTAVLFNQPSKSSHGFFVFEPHQQSSFGIISKQLSSISILLRDIFRRQNANKSHLIL